MHDIDCWELRAPACIFDIDVTRPYDEEVDVARFATAWCLVRRNGVPVAKRYLDIEADASIHLADLRGSFAAADLPRPVEFSSEVPKATLTVVIPTINPLEHIRPTLAGLARQSDPAFDVVVCDNSRDGELARTLTAYENLDIRCVHEPIQGVARARNRGLAEVTSEFVAWLDDDTIADPEWIAWVRRGFASPERPDAVAGLVLPGELETDAQVNYERYGGHNRGRGLEPVTLRAGSPTVFDPLFPLPNFGSGANMAFRTDVLRGIGGFDNRLGTGTLTCGGEETLAFSLVLETGSTILHWPPAVTWHALRRSDEALERQFFGYSAGLTAYYMSLILSSPRYLWRILGFIPRGVGRIRANSATGQPDGAPPGFPEHLLRAGRKGLYQGAFLYLREAMRQRRAERVC